MLGLAHRCHGPARFLRFDEATGQNAVEESERLLNLMREKDRHVSVRHGYPCNRKADDRKVY